MQRMLTAFVLIGLATPAFADDPAAPRSFEAQQQQNADDAKVMDWMNSQARQAHETIEKKRKQDQ